jgi:hypothetical protein
MNIFPPPEPEIWKQFYVQLNKNCSWKTLYLTGRRIKINMNVFIYLFVVLTVLFQLLHGVEWKSDKWMMNWKGVGRKRSWPNFKVLSRHSPRGTEKNQEKLWIVVSEPRFEIGASRILSRGVNH